MIQPSIDSTTIIEIFQESNINYTISADIEQTIKITELHNTTKQNKATTLMFFDSEFANSEEYQQFFSEGLKIYITNQSIGHPNEVVEILVEDVNQCISVISSEFYSHPEKHLCNIGYIGDLQHASALTLTQDILNFAYAETCTVYSCPTNPNMIVDLYKQMNTAVLEEKKFFLIDIDSFSEQIGALANIKFDVLEVISLKWFEKQSIYPDFESYYRSRVIFLNQAKKIIIERDIRRFEDVFRKAQQSETTKHIVVFGSKRDEVVKHCDIMFNETFKNGNRFLEIISANRKGQLLHLDGTYSLEKDKNLHLDSTIGAILVSKLSELNPKVIQDFFN